jgi:hypothetical protein
MKMGENPPMEKPKKGKKKKKKKKKEEKTSIGDGFCCRGM